MNPLPQKPTRAVLIGIIVSAVIVTVVGFIALSAGLAVRARSSAGPVEHEDIVARRSQIVVLPQASRGPAMIDCCSVLELRQYTVKPTERERLIALFDRHFVESQEALGMTIVGQFRDLQRPDRFVWIRGFGDMTSRHSALEQFYGGPVWARHRAEANSTMVDVSDVRLLKPAMPDTSFHIRLSDRPVGDEKGKGHAVFAVVHDLVKPVDGTMLPSGFADELTAGLRLEGVTLEGIFLTESAPNTFSQLPVREGEQSLVWFATADPASDLSSRGLQAATAAVGALAAGPPLVLKLEPTPRSLLGHNRSGR